MCSAKMKSSFERDLIYQSLYSATHLMSQDLDCVGKNSEYSQSFRKNGNEIYGKRNCDDKFYEQVHLHYSKSIAYAPIDSDDLAFAYGNRSALLHRMGKHEDSILDIDGALEINKLDIGLRFKLLCRKVECLAALGSLESRKIYNQAVQLVPKLLHSNRNAEKLLENMKNAEAAMTRLNQICKPKDESTPEHVSILRKVQAQDPYDSVAVEYSERFGRHLVATRNIKPGEVIFVEEPWVGCINNSNGHAYCGHCFVKTWASIPCDFCNWCMFCSKRCKDLAWMNYHDTECSVVSYLTSNEHLVDYPLQLTLRSLIKGVKESGGISNFQTEIESVDEWIDHLEAKSRLNSIFENGIILSNGFKSIYSLCGQVPSKIMRKYAYDVITILIILCKYTQFFGQNVKFKEAEDLQMNNQVLFIGSVLLKLWNRSNSSFNTLHDTTSSECRLANGSRNCGIVSCTKGACIPSLPYFINHDCYPNVQKCITDDCKVMVLSLLPISKNSQLFTAYQQPFYEADKTTRQEQLDQNLDSGCNCKACTLDWPTLKQLWRMPNDNPKLYMSNFNRVESDLYDEYNELVRPIIINCHQVCYNQAKIVKIANALEKAASCLQQPSVVVCELIVCLCLTFEKLYCCKSL